jgi:hypothetical protein
MRSRLALITIVVPAALLWAASATAAQADTPAGGAIATAQQRAGNPLVAPPPATGGGPDLPSVIVVPRSYQPDARLARGCWVRFFDDKSYRGRSLVLVGPVEMPKIHVPGGLWVNWSSAVVGPKATVTAYDYEQFKNRSAVLRAGQRIPDLKKGPLGLFEDIHSVRIACQG